MDVVFVKSLRATIRARLEKTERVFACPQSLWSIWPNSLEQSVYIRRARTQDDVDDDNGRDGYTMYLVRVRTSAIVPVYEMRRTNGLRMINFSIWRKWLLEGFSIVLEQS